MATHNVVAIVGSLRKESFTLKIANALAKLAPASLTLDVTTLHGISFFNQDLEAAPPADWLAFREKLQKSHGVLFVTPEYNRSIPGVLAALRQEFVPRQADRHCQQFPGPARWCQRRQASAKYLAGYLRADPGTAGNLSDRHRRRLRRQGQPHQGAGAEGIAAIYRRLCGLHRKAEQIAAPTPPSRC